MLAIILKYFFFPHAAVLILFVVECGARKQKTRNEKKARTCRRKKRSEKERERD